MFSNMLIANSSRIINSILTKTRISIKYLDKFERLISNYSSIESHKLIKHEW